MDRVTNEEVCRRAGIERQLGSRADQRVLRWFGLVKMALGGRVDYGSCATMWER